MRANVDLKNSSLVRMLLIMIDSEDHCFSVSIPHNFKLDGFNSLYIVHTSI